jgi:hypothetical protein
MQRVSVYLSKAIIKNRLKAKEPLADWKGKLIQQLIGCHRYIQTFR